MDATRGPAFPHAGDAAAETLREDAEFILYRLQQPPAAGGHPTLVLVPVGERAAPRTVARLQHEYSLRSELEPAWSVRPLALQAHATRPLLVLEDPGGEPLERLVGKPRELRAFLRIALGFCAALRQVHRQGLIHKDIKPANALVNVATGQVWLMGFGICSRLVRERQPPDPPECIAGTLAYMAPEQTGRMNRSIDSRSDLYSLGVTLYQVLTGTAPFSASDPQAAKMEAVGRLAGGIAHDFNNLLGAILGYGELAQDVLAEGSAVRRHVDNVLQAGFRGKALVERILAFSRSWISQNAPLHPQPIVSEALDMLAPSLSADVRLERQLDAADAAVIADATQLHEVVMNLCTNAVQSMERGGVLQVTLEPRAVADRRYLSHGTLSAGRYIRLCVSDTGTGVPPEVLERMFEPFFTTKRVGDGTGLGLALVHGIVSDFGGSIDVATRVGMGTTFTIWLPEADELPVPAAKPADEVPRGHGEVVMIVDDERALVALAEETLAELGYEPQGFDSSVAALEAFHEQPGRFDLVLTDEQMPGLTGTELARAIRQVRPEISIILMSGQGGTQLTERAQAAGVDEVLHKPLVRREIAEPLARALHATIRDIG